MSEFDLDRADDALTAMKAIAEKLKTFAPGSGTFTLTCPACKGTLRVAWDKNRRRSRPNTFAAVCDTTAGCLQFMGH